MLGTLGESLTALRRGLIVLFLGLTLTLTGCAEEVAAPSAAPTESAADQPKKKQAKVNHREIEVPKRIPFDTEVIETAELAEGETQVQQEGRAGVQMRIVRLTTRLGKVIERNLVRRFVSREPVTKVLLVGTRVDREPSSGGNCDPNYTGACVPIASDVDCAGGSGDGPEYVDGPVTVVGDDVYDLNRDSDNIACDS